MLTRPATIMRSAWRGDERMTSAPKREMSKRGAMIAIISMALQARPKPSGQIAFARAQFTSVSTLVKRTPRSTSARTASCSRSSRTGAGRGPAEGSDARNPGPRVRNGFTGRSDMAAPFTRGRGNACRPRSIPLQGALLQYVDVAHEEHRDEQHHLDQGDPAQVAERHGPGVEEHGLDVEQDEEHGDEIELDREALPRRPERIHATLVGRQLLPTPAPRHDEARQQDGAPGEGQGDEHRDQDRKPLAHARTAFSSLTALVSAGTTS